MSYMCAFLQLDVPHLDWFHCGPFMCQVRFKTWMNKCFMHDTEEYIICASDEVRLHRIIIFVYCNSVHGWKGQVLHYFYIFMTMNKVIYLRLYIM